MIQTNTNLKRQSGFTIVELLIVIVVIGILAAITIVAFNGVQNRGKTAASQSLADTVKKKAEAYNALNSAYPVDVAAFNDTATGATSETTLGDDAAKVTGTLLSATPTSTGPIVSYGRCPATGTATGATVTYWQYGTGTGAGAHTTKLGAGCP